MGGHYELPGTAVWERAPFTVLSSKRHEQATPLQSNGERRRETTMTLQQFLRLTSATPPAAVRHAMVVALATEPARTRDACARFYGRVVLALGLATEPDCGDVDRHGTGVAA